ncbi:CgeB family protein [Aliarcobacter cryaerophilus]|uniref:CgeB family protein n=1 Tax=Aliarcobacter cryaerophilus TaxID=28198 RepID=UPI003DA2073A
MENNQKTSIFFEKWCESNNIESCLLPLYDRLLFQIAYYNPDIIYIHEIWCMPNRFLENIRYINPNIKIIGWNCSSASLNKLKNQENIDSIFTCSKDMKKNLLENNFFNVTKINHMFEKDILRCTNKIKNKKYDIIFFGVLYKDYYKDRINLLKSLIYNKFKIVIFGDTDDEELKKYCKPAIYGKDIYQIIKQSKIVLNIHSNDSKFARNIRLFEVTGIGSFLISDYKPNMNKIFKEKVEAVTFKTNDEAIELIKYYLKNDKEREKIAMNGQKKTLRDYTYKILAKKIYKFSKREISTQKKFNHLLSTKEIYEQKRLELRDNLNMIIKQTKEINNKYNKIAIYGNGNISKLIKEYITNLIAIFDKSYYPNESENILNPENINIFDFDIIIISAIGYEKEIRELLISKYYIDENKIFMYKF